MYLICSMLTKKQKNLLLFINKKLRSSGVSPSYEEMKESLNLKSKSGIHRLISALEERGFIKRLAHKARALEVIKLPETASANGTTDSRKISEPHFLERLRATITRRVRTLTTFSHSPRLRSTTSMPDLALDRS